MNNEQTEQPAGELNNFQQDDQEYIRHLEKLSKDMPGIENVQRDLRAINADVGAAYAEKTKLYDDGASHLQQVDRELRIQNEEETHKMDEERAEKLLDQ